MFYLHMIFWKRFKCVSPIVSPRYVLTCVVVVVDIILTAKHIVVFILDSVSE